MIFGYKAASTILIILNSPSLLEWNESKLALRNYKNSIHNAIFGMKQRIYFTLKVRC